MRKLVSKLKYFKLDYMINKSIRSRKKAIRCNLTVLKICLFSILDIGYARTAEEKKLLQRIINKYEDVLKDINKEIIDKAKHYLD